MINTVDFISSCRMEAMQGNKSLAVVSITDPGSSNTRISADFGPVLCMKFDDLDADSLAAGSTGLVFAHGDAERVASFLDMVDRDASLQGVIIHCEMGRSRSGAIAWFALSYGDLFQLSARTRRQEALRLAMAPSGMLVPAGFKF